jgi:hypothetical protein
MSLFKSPVRTQIRSSKLPSIPVAKQTGGDLVPDDEFLLREICMGR